MKVIIAIIAVLALFPATSSASTIHTPLPGASVPQNGSLYFDWVWDEDEYWTTKIIFTQVADGTNPIWFGGDQPGKIRVSADYGNGWGESHATVDFSHWPFTAGQWYWRLCNNISSGEDDKCYQRGNPIPLTVTPAPLPPPPPVIVPSPPAPVMTPSRPFLSITKAKTYARRALKKHFKSAYTYGVNKKIGGTQRLSQTKVRFNKVSWGIGDVSYKGRVTIWITSKRIYYSYTIKRTNEYCKYVTHKKNCTKTYRR